MHYIGLHNIGNTCFFNSILQLLYQCTILNKIVLTKKIHGEFINVYLKFLQEYNSNNNAITPSIIVKFISNKLHRKTSSQEDAEEYLTYIIDLLLTELLKNTNYKIVSTLQLNYESIINHLFTINISKTIQCCNCDYKSNLEEKTYILYLSIDDNLSKSLSNYTRESVEWICEKCKYNKCNIKRHFIHIPKYLIILIKRFNNNNQKNIMPMHMYKNFHFNNKKYMLRGIIYQSGTTTGGHYMYYGNSDIWRLYNDANVTTITSIDNILNTGYLYLYVNK